MTELCPKNVIVIENLLGAVSLYLEPNVLFGYNCVESSEQQQHVLSPGLQIMRYRYMLKVEA